jgi:hypothetical protein
MSDYATLVIHQHRIALTDDADLDALLGAIVSHVRSGGGVVTVASRNGSTVDLVVTPSTQACLCRCGGASSNHADDGPWLAGVTLDY